MSVLIRNFLPVETKSVSASTASASAAFTGQGINVHEVRIYNATSSTAFFRMGVGAQTALTTDTPIAPGATEVFHKGFGADTLAFILASGSGTIYVTAGEGS